MLKMFHLSHKRHLHFWLTSGKIHVFSLWRLDTCRESRYVKQCRSFTPDPVSRCERGSVGSPEGHSLLLGVVGQKFRTQSLFVMTQVAPSGFTPVCVYVWNNMVMRVWKISSSCRSSDELMKCRWWTGAQVRGAGPMMSQHIQLSQLDPWQVEVYGDVVFVKNPPEFLREITMLQHRWPPTLTQ